jgi:hypothetical protein
VGHGPTICPICHREGYLEESCVAYGGREYCYWRVVHYYTDSSGRRRKRVHYFGPVGREYLRVESVHRLGLRDLASQDPVVIAERLVENLADVARALKHTKHVERYLLYAKKLREYLVREALPLLEELERELEEAARELREPESGQ